MLSFGFTPTRSDYLKAYWAYYLSNWQIWSVLILLVVPQGICIFSAILNGNYGSSSGWVFPFFLFLFLALFIVFTLVINPLRLANRVKKDPRLSSPVQYEVSEEQIIIKNQFSETKTDWGTFQRFVESKDVFLLIYTVNKNMFQLVPKRAFASSEEVDAFRKLLVAKNLKGKTNPFDIKKNPAFRRALMTN